MSLMQLLSVGHSFVGIKDEPSRYKLAENWLPRFGAVESTAPPPPRSVAPAVAAPDQRPFSPPSPRPAAILLNGVAPRLPMDSPPQTASAPTPGRAESPVSWRPLGSRAGKRSRPPLKHPELSLDGVKVVRNDLSDADLEILSVAGTAAPDPKPQSARARASQPRRRGWGQLAARLFNVGRALF